MGKNYFEIKYQGPFRGVNTSLPEDVIPIDSSPFCNNVILKNGSIRPRPRQDLFLPGPPDNNPILLIKSFLDQNNVYHTVIVTQTGLWQLNQSWVNGNNKKDPRKVWSLVGGFLTQPGPNTTASHVIFVDKFFWTNAGQHIWMWDGISSIGAPRVWAAKTAFRQGDVIVDSNGNLQIAQNSGVSKTGSAPVWGNTLAAQTTDNTIIWVENGKYIRANGFIDACIVDATNGLTAGGLYLIELNAQLLLCNTIESNGAFPQRIRWCPSGLPTIWDPNVNIGAGFNDELDVPDFITGAFTVGTTGFILRQNGITEITSNGSATNPFNFNHLWASDRGIGNVLPFGYASYGPLGIIVSEDEIYSVSMSGFKPIGKEAKDSIFRDIALSTNNPIGSIVPHYSQSFVYNHYRLSIPQGTNTVCW